MIMAPVQAIRAAVGKLLERLRVRKVNYQLAFGSPAGKEVLKDLTRFCRAYETCWHPNARAQAMMEGRRQVFLRIEQHLNLSPSDLAAIYRVSVLEQEEDGNG